MALLKKDKQAAPAQTEEQKTAPRALEVFDGGEDVSWVLQSPRITEKAAIQTADGVYTFNVHDDANKILIKKAIKSLYKVEPIKVRMVRNKPERIFARGYRGTKKGFKKAMVYLKKGDTIDFV